MKTQIYKTIPIALVLVVTLVFLPPAVKANILYAVTPGTVNTVAVAPWGTSGQLLTINTSTGAGTLIGQMDRVTVLSTDTPLIPIGLGARNGQLYTYDEFPVELEEGAQIIQLDPVTGHTLATIIPTDPLNGWLPDHSVHQFFSGSLTFRGSDQMAFLATAHDYGVVPDPGAQLSRLDGTLSQLTRIGQTAQNANHLLIEALAFDGNNVLYAINQPGLGIPVSLWTIDPATGAMSLVGSLGFAYAAPSSLHPTGMVFDSSGNLFVSLNSGDGSYDQPSSLYRVNKSTGAATLIGPIGFNNVVGLADLAVSSTPVVVTSPATQVTRTGATLNGTVNPRGATAYAWFEWGTTTSYGNSSIVFSVAPGTSTVNLGDALTGLASSITYHFRLDASNSVATVYGGDLTFTTLGPPIVTSLNDNGTGTLRDGILASLPGDTITFASGLTGTIMLTSGELFITNNLTIQGPGPKLLTINGNGASSVFHITNGIAKISGLTIAGGYNSVGGGIYSQYIPTRVNLSNCMIVSNTSTIYGGGGIWNEGTMSVVGCTIASNVTAGLGAGGGIYNAGVALGMTNCTITGNTATFFGGGAVFNAGPLSLASCTLASNTISATDGLGGGIYNYNSNWYTVKIQNTIVAGNSSVLATAPDVSGAFTSQGYNLIGNTNGSSGWGGIGDQRGSIASPVDPKLGPLQNNGGPTLTMPLRFGSPAIDKGKSFGLTTDQRGQTRPYVFGTAAIPSGGDGSDIGAVELSPPVLHIFPDTFNSLALFWDAYYPGYALESTPSLNPAVWTVLPGTPASLDPLTGRYDIELLAAMSRQFFRLAPIVAGSALSFNGTASYVSVGAAPLSPPWTAEFWVNRQDAPNFSASLLGDGSTALKLEQYSFSRQVGFTKFGVADYTFNYTAPAGTWVHLAFVCDTSTRLYVNGVLQDSNSYVIDLPLGRIGYDSSGNPDYLRGILDEVRVWNVARTQAQIQANMNHSLSVPQANLVGYWRFDEGSGTTVSDSSGQGKTGTLQNSPVWVNSTAPLVP